MVVPPSPRLVVPVTSTEVFVVSSLKRLLSNVKAAAFELIKSKLVAWLVKSMIGVLILTSVEAESCTVASFNSRRSALSLAIYPAFSKMTLPPRVRSPVSERLYVLPWKKMSAVLSGSIVRFAASVVARVKSVPLEERVR